jgi:hypothetical protein
MESVVGKEDSREPKHNLKGRAPFDRLHSKLTRVLGRGFGQLEKKRSSLASQPKPNYVRRIMFGIADESGLKLLAISPWVAPLPVHRGSGEGPAVVSLGFNRLAVALRVSTALCWTLLSFAELCLAFPVFAGAPLGGYRLPVVPGNKASLCISNFLTRNNSIDIT